MNAELARLALIVVGSALALGIAGASVVSAVVAWKNPDASTRALASLIEGGNSIRLLSATGVVIATTVLALVGALTEGAVTLLSGVAGFMLGGLRPPPRRSN